MKLGTLASLGATVALAGTAVMGVAATPAWAGTISQPYSCSTTIGPLSETVSITGTATINKTTKVISLSGVVFTVNNTSGYSLTVNHVKLNVADPNKTSAPYKAGSAKVGTTPPGWTAGHGSTGAFALFAGSTTIANGATVSNAPLSAKYTDAGPAGTKISFKPGKVSFNLTSPSIAAGPVSCTPSAPVGTIASVTE